MPWTVVVHSPMVEAELEAQPADIRVRFSRYAALIENRGSKGCVSHT